MLLWLPVNRMQVEYLRCTAFETLAGGAAGPGKSEALLLKRLRHVQNPKYRGLILRASFPELQELMDRADELFPRFGAGWNHEEKRYTFPSGASIEFGYLTTFAEVRRYRGQEYTTVDYDEIGDLLEERSWTFLATRVRTKDRRMRPQMGCSANPGGVAHRWLKRRFIDPCGEHGEHAHTDRRTGLTRRFIPGRVTENTVLMVNNPEYLANIRSNPEMVVRQLEHGDWTAGQSSALSEMDSETHLIPAFRIPPYWHTWGAFDWGFRHPFVFVVLAQNEDGDVFLVESVMGRLLLDEEIVERIREHLLDLDIVNPDGSSVHLGNMLPRITVAGHDCWHDYKARSESGPTTAEVFAKLGLPLTQANISRVSGLKNLRQYLAYRGRGPNGKDGVPQFRMFDTENNRKVFDTLEAMVPDPNNSEDVLKVDADDEGNGGDDAYDCVRYGLMRRPLKVKKPQDAPKLRHHYDGGYDRIMQLAAADLNPTRGF